MKKLIFASLFVVVLGGWASFAFADSSVGISASATYNSHTGQITYTVPWNVATSSAMTNLVISFPIPAGTSFVSAQNGGVLSGNQVIWHLGNQSAGASGSVSFMAMLDAAASLNPWVWHVQSSSGVTQGTSITGTNDGQSATIGPGGFIVLEFAVPIVKGPGDDIKIFSNGSLDVAVGNDVNNFFGIGNFGSNASIDLGSNLDTYKYIKLVNNSSQSVMVDAVESLQLFPFSCAIIGNPSITGTVNGIAATSTAQIRLDIIQGCASGYGSGLGSGGTGSGLSGGFNPDVLGGGGGNSTSTPPSGGNTGNSTTTPPSSGGSGSTNPGGSTGGGSSNPGGSGLSTSTPPTGGGSTGSGNPPEGMGGSNEQPIPQVLGESTTLPRTGIAAGFIVLILLLGLTPFLFPKKKSF